MTTKSSRSTVRYRFTTALEVLPQKGEVLHASGLTNWHMVVQEIGQVVSQANGTITLEMMVDRWDIGREQGPCMHCGAAWKEEGI